MRQRDRIHEREQSITRSLTIVTPAVTQRATASLTLRKTSVPSRVTPIATSTRTPVARNHTPSLVPLPTMKVMMPNAPTPYSVTRLYPVISEVFSAPGTGR
jgi:hypothetical protein